MEFKIVQLLIKNPGRVFSRMRSTRAYLERESSQHGYYYGTCAEHPEKIEIDPRNPKYLKVVWGVGYKIDKQ